MLKGQAPLARPQLRRCARFGSERRLRCLLNLLARRLDSPFHLRMHARQARRYVSRRCRGAQNTGAFVPEPDPVPLDAYGDAPYDEPVPYGDEDAFVGDATAYSAAPASPAKRRGGGEARRSPAAASSVPDFNRMAREAAARTSAAAGLPPEPTDANTSASIDATGPNGEPAGSEFGARPMTWPLCSQREVSRARASKK